MTKKQKSKALFQINMVMPLPRVDGLDRWRTVLGYLDRKVLGFNKAPIRIFWFKTSSWAGHAAAILGYGHHLDVSDINHQ
jgi:hypothetical protein